ncbi:hypothetical protein MSP8886_00835 [Marinomonas spartinae]|uniref:Uncharacterized protein n=1 Tax=Marinomonas spartinae TaxID=1792290 RepID=A0A1A8T4L8_9GAMM|nr:hypothetical protein MSP8886_00835 [Marinomonas spartinae]
MTQDFIENNVGVFSIEVTVTIHIACQLGRHNFGGVIKDHPFFLDV